MRHSRHHLRRAGALAALVASLLVGGAALSADDAAPPRPARIHRGTCEAVDPTPAYPLGSLMPPAGDEDAEADGGAIPAAMSVTTLDLPLADLLAGSYVINVHESEAEMGEELACGAIAGKPTTDGLAVGLAPHGIHGDFSGIAWLRPEGDRTIVAVFLVEGIEAARVAPPAAGAEPEAVAVTLGGPDGEFAVTADRSSFRVGVPYRFVVTNAGRIPHEFTIIPAIPADGTLPPMEGMPMPAVDMSRLGPQERMEAIHHLALAAIDEEDLPPGETQEVEITFTKSTPSGSLELACYVPGHYEAGMHIPIEVVP